MILDGKLPQRITEADLEQIVSVGESEGKTLEFKADLPGNTDDNKREFLSDVSSFANASGGFLIYGISEDAGIAKGLEGIPSVDPDADVLRLDNIIRDGLQPRIPGLLVRSIALTNSKFAIIIQIPQSWIGPHMVTFRNNSRFFSRNSAGKYQLDIQEIRQSVLLSDNLAIRVRNFHLDRLSKVMAGETSVLIGNGAKVIMHLIPISSLQGTATLNIKDAGSKFAHLETLHGSPHSFRYNIDGIVAWMAIRDDKPVSYVQLFRNGIIEAVDAYLLREREGEKKFIPSTALEEAVIEASSKLLGFQKQAGITPPILIFVSLIDVKGYKLAISQRLRQLYWMRDQEDLVDRDILMLPEITIETYEEVDLWRLLRPIFDAIWNATGWSESLNYDPEGKWIGQ